MNQADVAKQLRGLYTQEVAKLRGLILRCEEWVDAGLQLRKQLDQNIANLSRAVADLDNKIERGEDIGDWWRTIDRQPEQVADGGAEMTKIGNRKNVPWGRKIRGVQSRVDASGRNRTQYSEGFSR